MDKREETNFAKGVNLIASLCKFGYRKIPKFWDARKLYCNHPKTGLKRFYHRVMYPKDGDSIANSADPDQTAPLGAV